MAIADGLVRVLGGLIGPNIHTTPQSNAPHLPAFPEVAQPLSGTSIRLELHSPKDPGSPRYAFRPRR